MRREPTDVRLIEIPAWFARPEQKFPDVRSIVRREFASATEAEQEAQSVGVSAVYEGNRLIATLAHELLTQLHERNLPMPMSVIVSNRFFQDLGADGKTVIGMSENDVILFNPDAPFWSDIIGSSYALYEARFWSTPHPLHALYHEAGHIAQSPDSERQRILTLREVGIAKAVSDRAKANGDEFVSEVFAGLMTGIKYDADILRMYRRLGGRKP